MHRSSVFDLTNASNVFLPLLLLSLPAAFGQGPPMRRHTSMQSESLQLVPATMTTRFRSQVSITEQRGFRIIQVNGIPAHAVGQFPNRGNPHSIAQSNGTYRVTLNPKQNRRLNPLQMNVNFGVAVNGVMFDPGAAEFWLGNPRSGWQYEALVPQPGLQRPLAASSLFLVPHDLCTHHPGSHHDLLPL